MAEMPMKVEESGILRLRLIGLDQIIQNVAEEAYRQVKEYQDVLKKEGDTQISNRARSLLKHLHCLRQRLQKLKIILRWSKKAAALAECQRVLEVSASHLEACRDSADQLVYLHGELFMSKAPQYDVQTALHILQRGQCVPLPSVIEEHLGAEHIDKIDYFKQEKEEKTLGEMDFIMRAKLLDEDLPNDMLIEKVSRGECTIRHSKGIYRVIMSIVPSPSDRVTASKWRVEVNKNSSGFEKEHEKDLENKELPVTASIENNVFVKEEPNTDVVKMEEDVEMDEHQINPISDNEVIDAKLEYDAVGDVSVTQKWRWRLLNFELLAHDGCQNVEGVVSKNFREKGPSQSKLYGYAMPPDLLLWLQNSLEERIWAIEDMQQLIRLGHSSLISFPYTTSQHGKTGATNETSGDASTPSEAVSATSEKMSENAVKPPGSPETVFHTKSCDFPSWTSSPLVMLHCILQNLAARIAVGSILATGFEYLISESTDWHGKLRIDSVPKERQGIRLRFWSDIPFIRHCDVEYLTKKQKTKTSQRLDLDRHEFGSIGITGEQVENNSQNGIKTLYADEKPKSNRLSMSSNDPSHRDLGCTLDILLSAQLDFRQEGDINSIIETHIHPEVYDTQTQKQIPVDIFDTFGLKSAELILSNAAAICGKLQLSGLVASLKCHAFYYSMMTIPSSADEINFGLSILEDRKLAFDIPSCGRVDIYTAELCFLGNSLLILHISLKEGKPIISGSPSFLENITPTMREKAVHVIKNAQDALDQRSKSILNEVIPADIKSRGIFWAKVQAHIIALAWKELILEFIKYSVSSAAFLSSSGYFSRVEIPSCLTFRELQESNNVSNLEIDVDKFTTISKRNREDRGGSIRWMQKENCLFLSLRRYKNPVNSLLWNNANIPVGERGSISCFLCIDIDLKGKDVARISFLACKSSFSGVPTNLFRFNEIPNYVYGMEAIGHQANGLEYATSGGKRKRENINNASTSEASMTLKNIWEERDIKILSIDWSRLLEWTQFMYTWYQIYAQIQSLHCDFRILEEFDQNECRNTSKIADITSSFPFFCIFSVPATSRENRSTLKSDHQIGGKCLIACVDLQRPPSTGGWKAFVLPYSVEELMGNMKSSEMPWHEYFAKVEDTHHLYFSFSDGQTVASAIENLLP